MPRSRLAASHSSRSILRGLRDSQGLIVVDGATVEVPEVGARRGIPRPLVAVPASAQGLGLLLPGVRDGQVDANGGGHSGCFSGPGFVALRDASQSQQSSAKRSTRKPASTPQNDFSAISVVASVGRGRCQVESARWQTGDRNGETEDARTVRSIRGAATGTGPRLGPFGRPACGGRP